MNPTTYTNIRTTLEKYLNEWERCVTAHNEFEELGGVNDDDDNIVISPYGDDLSRHPGNFNYEKMFQLVLSDALASIVEIVEDAE